MWEAVLPLAGGVLSPKFHDAEYGPVPPVIVVEKLEGLPAEAVDGGVMVTASGCGETVIEWLSVVVAPLASPTVRIMV